MSFLNLIRSIGFLGGATVFCSVLFLVLSFFGKINRSLSLYLVFAAIAFALSFIYLLFQLKKDNRKSFFKNLKEGFQDYGKMINNIVNFILLFIVYILGVGVSFLFAKLSKKKVMDLEISKTRKSYWKDYNLGKEKKSSYYRQF